MLEYYKHEIKFTLLKCRHLPHIRKHFQKIKVFCILYILKVEFVTLNDFFLASLFIVCDILY